MRVEAVRRELAVASSVVRLVLVRAEDQPLDAARNAAVQVVSMPKEERTAFSQAELDARGVILPDLT